eukprot:scpid80910/ scgid35556/ 
MAGGFCGILWEATTTLILTMQRLTQGLRDLVNGGVAQGVAQAQGAVQGAVQGVAQPAPAARALPGIGYGSIKWPDARTPAKVWLRVSSRDSEVVKKASANKQPREIVVRVLTLNGLLPIYGNSYDDLLSGRMIDDNIMDAFLAKEKQYLTTKYGPRFVKFISSQVYAMWAATQDENDFKSWPMFTTDAPLEAYRYVVIPIEKDAHWTAVIANMKTKSLQEICSMGYHSPTRIQHSIAILNALTGKTSQWSMARVTPKIQSNGLDCGPLLLVEILYVLMGKTFDFGENEGVAIRKWIARILLV